MGFAADTLTIDTRPEHSAAAVARQMSVVAIEDFDLLEDYVQAWEDLAANAFEPNPFYEPWMLMPALRWLTTNKQVRVVLVLAHRQGAPVLCGVFPLEKNTRYKKLPVGVCRMWQHRYCALCTPLLRADCARETLDAFLDWLESKREFALMEFNLVPGEGPFQELLNGCLKQRGLKRLIRASHTRALFRPRESAEAYVRAAVSPKHRQDMRRLERRLSEIGRVESSALETERDVDRWIEDFLQLEASGWKGRHASAFASSEAGRNYFTSIAREAFRRGKLLPLGIRLDGRPLAQRLSFIAGRGAFAFKTAYDETHARFSPGILLELENIRHLHATPGIEWMDSCATPVHFINRFWLDRRSIQTVLVSTGCKTGNLLISLWPFMTWLNRKIRSARKEGE